MRTRRFELESIGSVELRNKIGLKRRIMLGENGEALCFLLT